MERRAAIAALPHPYAVALRLHDAGATADAIACALDIDPAGVPMALRIGREKLDSLLESSDAR